MGIRKRKEGDAVNPDNAPQVNPFEQARGRFTEALVKGEVEEMGTHLDRAAAYLSAGIKPGDIPGLARRYEALSTLLIQATVAAREHGQAGVAEAFTLKAEGFASTAQVLNPIAIEKTPTTPPSSQMSAGKGS